MELVVFLNKIYKTLEFCITDLLLKPRSRAGFKTTEQYAGEDGAVLSVWGDFSPKFHKYSSACSVEEYFILSAEWDVDTYWVDD